MAEITQIITQFPPAPDSATDTPQEFNTKANAFVNHQSDSYVGEVNTWATQANAVRDDVNNIVASIPDGLIDDTTPSLVNTYSSQKIEDDFIKKSEVDNVNYGIVQVPNNGNGEGIKLPDGTMILNGRTTSSSGWGGTGKVINLPASFINTSFSLTANCQNVASSSTAGSYVVEPRNTAVNQIALKVLTHADTAITDIGTTITVTWQVIGRWK